MSSPTTDKILLSVGIILVLIGFPVLIYCSVEFAKIAKKFKNKTHRDKDEEDKDRDTNGKLFFGIFAAILIFISGIVALGYYLGGKNKAKTVLYTNNNEVDENITYKKGEGWGGLPRTLWNQALNQAGGDYDDATWILKEKGTIPGKRLPKFIIKDGQKKRIDASDLENQLYVDGYI